MIKKIDDKYKSSLIKNINKDINYYIKNSGKLIKRGFDETDRKEYYEDLVAMLERNANNIKKNL